MVRSHLIAIYHAYPEVHELTRQHLQTCQEVSISIPNFSVEEIKTALENLFKQNDLLGLQLIFNLHKNNMTTVFGEHESEKTAEEETIEEHNVNDKMFTNHAIKIDEPDNQLVSCSDNRQSLQIEIEPNSQRRANSLDESRAEPNCNLAFNPKQIKFGDKICKCEECEMKFANITHLKEHKDSVHKGILYSCSLCDYKSPYKYNLNKHTKYKHTESQKQMKHICTICGKTYAKKNGLTDHELTHNERTLKCEMCGTSFYNILYLKRHHRTVHGEENFSCDVCGRKFTTKPRLKDHFNSIHLNHADRKHVCKLCGQGFHKIIAYKNHMNKHLGLKPYECPAEQCEKSFSDDTSWAHHKKSCALLKLITSSVLS